MLHRARHKNDQKVKGNNMKKTIVLLLSVATMIGCISMPIGAASYKINNKWMKTWYYNSYMADRGYVDFKRSPARSDPANNPETVTMRVWLKGKDGKVRGERKVSTFILINSCGTNSNPVDHDYGNTPGGKCVIE